MHVKKMILKVFLMIEMGAFGFLYICGTNGIKLLHEQKLVITQLKNEFIQFQHEVNQLEKEIYAWQTDDFYKEKVAREQLQMARKGDELFYIGM